MFPSSTIALVASLSLLVAKVQADVTPIEPSPSTPPFNEGAECKTTWTADTNVTTQAFWKSMNIQLMTGSNWDMKHVSTVGTDQDGTVDGSFTYPCPAVKPNAAVYFYQYSSPLTKTVMWTTRFTIAAADGTVEDAPNKTQPGGESIPWGIGALEDPSKVVAPPSYLPGGSTPAPSGSASSTASGGLSTFATSSFATSSSGSGSRLPSSTSGSAPASSSTGSRNNGAVGALSVSGSMQKALVVLGVSAMGFVVVL